MHSCEAFHDGDKFVVDLVIGVVIQEGLKLRWQIGISLLPIFISDYADFYLFSSLHVFYHDNSVVNLWLLFYHDIVWRLRLFHLLLSPLQVGIRSSFLNFCLRWARELVELCPALDFASLLVTPNLH